MPLNCSNPAQILIELQTLNNQEALVLIEGSQWQKNMQPQRNKNILLKMHSNNIPDFNEWLVQQSIKVLSLQSRHSLEDYFLQITSGTQHVAAFEN
jgi:hypothetical protein